MKKLLVLLVAAVVFVGIAQAGLISFYDFENASATTAFDQTSSHDGTLIGQASKVSDPARGQVLNVRNWSDYVNIGTWNPSASTGELTIAAWTYWRGAAGAGPYGIMSKRTSFSGTGMMWQFDVLKNGTIRLWGSGGGITTTAGTMPQNAWAQVAATVTAGGIGKIFVDGTLVKQGNFTLGQGTAATFSIGSVQATAQSFEGMIDNVRIYDNALSDAQVAAIPEPITIALLAVGTLLMHRRKR